jgi:hypothetical protein
LPCDAIVGAVPQVLGGTLSYAIRRRQPQSGDPAGSGAREGRDAELQAAPFCGLFAPQGSKPIDRSPTRSTRHSMTPMCAGG